MVPGVMFSLVTWSIHRDCAPSLRAEPHEANSQAAVRAPSPVHDIRVGDTVILGARILALAQMAPSLLAGKLHREVCCKWTFPW